MANADLNINSTLEAVNSTPSETHLRSSQLEEYDFDWMTTVTVTLNHEEENVPTTRLDDTTSPDSLPVLTGEEVEAFLNKMSSLGLEMPEIDIDIGKYLNSELYGDDLPLLNEYLPQSGPDKQLTSDQVLTTTSELLNQQELQQSQTTVHFILSPVEDAKISESMKTIDQTEEEPPVIAHETISLIKSSMLLLCENLPEDLKKATDGFEVQGDSYNPQGVESMSYIEDVGFSSRYTNPFTSCAPIDRIPPAREGPARLNFEIDKNNNQTCQYEEKVKVENQEDYTQSNKLTGPCLTALPPGTWDKLEMLPNLERHSEEKSMSVPCLEQLPKPEEGEMCQPTLEEGRTSAELKKYRRRSDFTSLAARRHACDVCEARFTAPYHLKVHQRTHTGERPYACDVCEVRFTESGSLKIHKRIHTNEERPYACDVCPAKFIKSGDLKKHRRIHTNERPYACDICEARFTESSHLKSHMRIHTNEKPYSCDVCEARFTESGSLKRHMRIHTNEKPYACDVCEVRFTESGNLKSHRRTHTIERPYACDICLATFIQSSNLKSHMRTHTGERPYACDICLATFIQSSSLKRHMRTHTGERPYICDICPAKFIQSGDLKKHRRIHTNERPYACDLCEARFIQSGDLKKHKRTHTK